MGEQQWPRRSLDEIEKALLDAYNKAGKKQRQTAEQLVRVTNAIPHYAGNDGHLLVKQAADASRSALEEYRKALNRFNDFVLRGIIPEDLQPPQPPKATSEE